MSIKIVETVSKEENEDAKSWYEDKLKQLALFLANQVKNQLIFSDSSVYGEKEKLEVMVK